MPPEDRAVAGRPGGWYARGGKRLLDLAVAVPALLALSPLLLLLGLTVRLGLGRPVLFRQQRPGRGGRLFVLYKFRSMSQLADESGQALPDHERLESRVGRLLRRTSLDELPELWNVLRGEMSLVGPRPLRARYLERYSPTQARRHLIRPGITGWAQVRGRNAVGWPAKLALDVWYVDHLSLALDLKILALTVWKVVSGEGVHAPGHATMTEFMGDVTETDPGEPRAR